MRHEPRSAELFQEDWSQGGQGRERLATQTGGRHASRPFPMAQAAPHSKTADHNKFDLTCEAASHSLLDTAKNNDMSKRHFRALAEHLAITRPAYEGAERRQWENDVTAVAQVCEAFNPNFDRRLFMQHAVRQAESLAALAAERE